MLTVGELKEFIKDIPDDYEVRLETETDRDTDEGIHHECTEIMGYNGAEGKYIILTPDETYYIHKRK